MIAFQLSLSASVCSQTVMLVAVDRITEEWLGMTGSYFEDGEPEIANVVSVWVAPEARYHVAGPLGLRDPELGHRPQVRRCVGRFLLLVVDDPLLVG